jgi:hypothetical protein
MGAHPYWYFVPYDPDVQGALRALREREFAAGRYSPVVRMPVFGAREPESFVPAHPNISAACEEAARSGEGTRSILDIARVSQEREMGSAAPLAEDQIIDMFDSSRPTREVVEARLEEVFGVLDRGECVYVSIYDGEEPTELLFAGYSYD